jgi:hypothetical protein
MHLLAEPQILAVERDRLVNIVDDVPDADACHQPLLPAGTSDQASVPSLAGS